MVREALEAAGFLIRGEVILYPTDTVWGLGCDATNRDAVDKVYRLKERSDTKSMLVLMSGLEMLGRFVRPIPPKAIEIMNEASRPTTIVYHGATGLASNLLARDQSVGIRITSDPFCLKLIEITGIPIVSTSANISGQHAPRIFREIDPLIIQRADHVVHWKQDETSPALPSTVLKLELDGRVKVLRRQ
jgi:L-threonylcarbamoyladenylate synthase